MTLQELQALRRCQRKHPADQRQVDAVFAINSLRFGIPFRHIILASSKPSSPLRPASTTGRAQRSAETQLRKQLER